MTDLVGLGVQLERPGLQDLSIRGYHVCLRVHERYHLRPKEDG